MCIGQENERSESEFGKGAVNRVSEILLVLVKTDTFSSESNLETAIEIFTSFNATAQYYKKIIYDQEMVL